MTAPMPTLKAIHICNSHQPSHHQKLQKSMALPTLTDKQVEKEHQLVTLCIVHLMDSANIKGVTSNKLCNDLTGLCFESPNDTIHVTDFCPLCHCVGEPFYRDLFFVCSSCFGIFKAKKFLLNKKDEQARYENHHNDIFDPNYQKFVTPITLSVLKDFSKHSLGLDFGAGTGPVISKILKDQGYTLNQYDPFFINTPKVLELKYDYIVCCEVIEHFYHPEKEFKLLKNLLQPHGRLYCMTHIYNPKIDFENWYYKNDPTHVFIYQEATMIWIKNNFNFASVTIDNRLISFVN